MRRIKSNCIRIGVALLIFMGGYSTNCLAQSTTDIAQKIEKATAGDGDAQSDLIYHYCGVSEEYEEGIKWCNILIGNTSAKEHEREYAYRILGLSAKYGRGMVKSQEKAIECWKQGVHLNGKYSAVLLAEIYEQELRDSVAAIKWYQKAAELEEVESTLFLAQLYEDGFVVKGGERVYYPNIEVDILKSATYYYAYVGFMRHAYVGYLRDLRKKIPANPKLLYKLGNWYFDGKENLPNDFEKAFDLYNLCLEIVKEKCEAKNRLTQEEEGNLYWNLSVCYRFGRGVEKDELYARRYVKKAAEKGNPRAIALLNE